MSAYYRPSSFIIVKNYINSSTFASHEPQLFINSDTNIGHLNPILRLDAFASLHKDHHRRSSYLNIERYNMNMSPLPLGFAFFAVRRTTPVAVFHRDDEFDSLIFVRFFAGYTLTDLPFVAARNRPARTAIPSGGDK